MKYSAELGKLAFRGRRFDSWSRDCIRPRMQLGTVRNWIHSCERFRPGVHRFGQTQTAPPPPPPPPPLPSPTQKPVLMIQRAPSIDVGTVHGHSDRAFRGAVTFGWRRRGAVDDALAKLSKTPSTGKKPKYGRRWLPGDRRRSAGKDWLTRYEKQLETDPGHAGDWRKRTESPNRGGEGPRGRRTRGNESSRTEAAAWIEK